MTTTDCTSHDTSQLPIIMAIKTIDNDYMKFTQFHLCINIAKMIVIFWLYGVVYMSIYVEKCGCRVVSAVGFMQC